MNQQTFWQELNARIAKFDLLCHPYYQAWKMGSLTKQDLRSYACDYYHHVAAFPDYLDELASRLPASTTRDTILQNKLDEEGSESQDGRSHAELWLDFVEDMGGTKQDAISKAPIKEIKELINIFFSFAQNSTTAEALAAFYAYESQVPQIAEEKARGLREKYRASDKACNYFDVHTEADIYHSQIWRKLIEQELEAQPENRQAALDAAEFAAQSLWHALDGIEEKRKLAA